MKNQTVNRSLGIFPKSWSEERAGRIPGNIPIWVGILSELTEFGIFFAAYFIAKFYFCTCQLQTMVKKGSILFYLGLCQRIAQVTHLNYLYPKSSNKNGRFI